MEKGEKMSLKDFLERDLKDKNELLTLFSNFLPALMKDPNRFEKEDICLVIEAQSIKSKQIEFNNASNKPYQTSQQLFNHAAEDWKNFRLVFAKDLIITPLSYEEYDRYLRIPSVLVLFERMAQIREFKLFYNMPYLKEHLMLKALNSQGASSICNYETLETLGDTVMKIIVSIVLYLGDKSADPNKLTKVRSAVTCNEFLGERGIEAHLLYALKSSYQSLLRYTPPFFERQAAPQDEKKKEKDTEEEKHILSDKMIADCVEATIGKYL